MSPPRSGAAAGRRASSGPVTAMARTAIARRGPGRLRCPPRQRRPTKRSRKSWPARRRSATVLRRRKIATFTSTASRASAASARMARRVKPDVACLQELKTPARPFRSMRSATPATGRSGAGRSRSNGVAILSRGRDPSSAVAVCRATRTTCTAAIRGQCRGRRRRLDLPADGNPQPGPKFDYKRPGRAPEPHAAELLAARLPTCWPVTTTACRPTPTYSPASWLKDALLQPESRDAYRRLLSQGWTDAIRHLHPDARSTRSGLHAQPLARDAGLRIDHLLLSPSITDRLVSAGVDREVRGREKASDHAPTWVELR